MNRGRSRHELEYELIDTGVFDDSRYFDVEVEHAKAGPEDIVCRVTVHNRSSQDAGLHVLPTLWFRNTWSWEDDDPKPRLARVESADPVVRAEHHQLGVLYLYAEPEAALLFCENETNTARVFGAEPATRFPKDGIGDHLLHGARTVNPEGEGTKVAAQVRLLVPAGGQAAVLVRLTREGPETLTAPFAGAAELIARRRAEADEFYEAITPSAVTDDAKAVMRQALAGMLWSKQCYYFDVDRWLRERHLHPLRAPTRRGSRNESWFHMVNHDVVSMPDKWEYPWYAAWDLAFHCLPLAMVDPEFAKSQLDLMLSEGYLHSTGQMPAYEWNFGDVNPPVHAFATLFLTNQDLLANIADPFVPGVHGRRLLSLVNEDKLRRILARMFEVAQELSRRLAGTFLRDSDGRRPVYGGAKLFQDDPHWRDLILFYEYFHGDNGAGLGASHQTGWTGLVARLIQSQGQFDADTVLNDREWPMARPYRRLAAGPMPDVTTAREARGVTEPPSPS